MADLEFAVLAYGYLADTAASSPLDIHPCLLEKEEVPRSPSPPSSESSVDSEELRLGRREEYPNKIPQDAVIPNHHYVMISLASHPCQPLGERVSKQPEAITSPHELYCHTTDRDQESLRGRLLQSSMYYECSDEMVHSSPHGFVNACIKAHNEHLHLIIRPDDVWFAILLQFGTFVRGNAELLRHSFVNHRFKDSFHLKIPEDPKMGEAARESLWSGDFLCEVVVLVKRHMRPDSSFHEWILPGFSTTTIEDKVVGNLMFLEVMSNYFS
jgi:hypothetical protein